MRFSDFELIFFFVSIYMYKEIIAPPTRQKVIDEIDRYTRKMAALEIIIISLAGLW